VFYYLNKFTIKEIMKKTISLALLLHSMTSLQTLDLNSLRLAQKQMSKPSSNTSNSSRKRNSETSFLIDKPVSKRQYYIGPGDQIHINIMSSNETFDYSLLVSPTGELLIPSVGIINTNGLNLQELVDSIESKIKSWNLNAQVSIELEGIREFKILVTGQFDNAGYFIATPMTRVSDLFDNLISDYVEKRKGLISQTNNKSYSETIGIQSRIAVDDLYNRKMGTNFEDKNLFERLSKRNIIIIRKKDTIKVDLEKFKVSGDTLSNPYVNQGDILNIPYINSYFHINGGVQKPGKYEFKTNETLKEAIIIAGGFRNEALKEDIKIIHYALESKTPSVFHFKNKESYFIEPEDHIMIPFVYSKESQKVVQITGEVKYPGSYFFETGKTTLGELINSAGGFTQRADTAKVFLNNTTISNVPDRELERILLKMEINRSIEENAYLKARIRSQKGSLETSLNKIINNKDIIMANDIIHIPIYAPYIEVIGAITFPGRYPFISENSVRDYIEKAGGIIKNKSAKKFLVKSTTGQRIKLKKDHKLMSGDIIFIAEKLEYNEWYAGKEILTALGQVATLVVVIQRIMETN